MLNGDRLSVLGSNVLEKRIRQVWMLVVLVLLMWIAWNIGRISYGLADLLGLDHGAQASAVHGRP